MNWFVTRQAQPTAPVQLFCLPYAGGGAGAYRDWPQEVGPAAQVHALQLPGRERRIRESPVFSVTDVADAIAGAVDRPFALYGHSMGGWLAYEVVRELRATGNPLPVALFTGACRAPQSPIPEVFAGLSRLDDEELIRRLTGAGGIIPAAVLADPVMLQVLLPVLRADLAWVDDYFYQPSAPLPVALHAFHGRTDEAVTGADTAGWRAQTAAAFTRREFDAGHFFLNDCRAELVTVVLDHLAAARTPTGS